MTTIHVEKEEEIVLIPTNLFDRITIDLCGYKGNKMLIVDGDLVVNSEIFSKPCCLQIINGSLGRLVVKTVNLIELHCNCKIRTVDVSHNQLEGIHTNNNVYQLIAQSNNLESILVDCNLKLLDITDNSRVRVEIDSNANWESIVDANGRTHFKNYPILNYH